MSLTTQGLCGSLAPSLLHWLGSSSKKVCWQRTMFPRELLYMLSSTALMQNAVLVFKEFFSLSSLAPSSFQTVVLSVLRLCSLHFSGEKKNWIYFSWFLYVPFSVLSCFHTDYSGQKNNSEKEKMVTSVFVAKLANAVIVIKKIGGKFNLNIVYHALEREGSSTCIF